jgi:hypothetical protein
VSGLLALSAHLPGRLIMERELDPCIVFSFSKKECETYALQMSRCCTPSLPPSPSPPPPLLSITAITPSAPSPPPCPGLQT